MKNQCCRKFHEEGIETNGNFINAECDCSCHKPLQVKEEQPVEEDWEKEFDQKIGLKIYTTSFTNEMKDFIFQRLAHQKEQQKIRIGMLRQWLNEDRITDTKKMVSNDDIIYWLNLK